MSDDDVIWEAEEHTKAKHGILKGYLDAWAPIMSQEAARSFGRAPLYVDAFAGPGIYKYGVDGSPLVAMKAVLDHEKDFPLPIRMSFIELKADYFESLEGQVAPFRDRDRSRVVVENVMNTSCELGLRNLLTDERKRFGVFGPALFFLDQFGYSHVPMNLIGELLSGVSCEALIYLNFQRMHPYLADSSKAKALTRAFGSQSWKAALNLTGAARANMLRDLYIQALNQAGARYVWHFEMRGSKNELIYWLFFCTLNKRGLEVMKPAMGRLDLTGNFRFSDRDVNQLSFLEKRFDLEWLAEHLASEFAPQTLTKGEIEMYVLTETPRVAYAKALQRLRAQGRIGLPNQPPGVGNVSFVDLDESEPIEFLLGSKEQTSLF